MIQLLVVSLLWVVPSMSAVIQTESFDVQGLKELVLRNASGNVEISSGEVSSATVKVEKEEFGETCALSMEKNGGVLFIEVQRQNLFGDSCMAHFKLDLPQGLKVNVDNGSGNLKVAGNTNSVSFKLGNGDVRIQSSSEKVDGRVGQGDIRIESEAKNLDLRTGSGEVQVIFPKIPSSGDLNIRTGNGNATVFVPRAASVNPTLVTGNGKILSELPESKSGFPISMKSGRGNLSIKAR